MFSLVRSGPKIYVVETQSVEEMKAVLIADFDAVEYDMDTAFEKASEYYTLLFLTDLANETLDDEEVKSILLIKKEADAVICRFFSWAHQSLIKSLRPAPKILILRVIGEIETVLKDIQADMGGEIGNFKDMLDAGNAHSTLVALTERPLNRNMSLNDLFSATLRLQGKHPDFVKALRMHALKYLNTGLGNRDWNEIEIRIFDRYSAYELHYDRLIELFESMELGLVLGESWSKDYPRLFMSVEVYRVRFFTFYEPKYIKQLLLGMEYTEDGTRIVDFDVYFNHKKMDWTDALEKDTPRSRLQAGLHYKAMLNSRIGSKGKQELERLENQVMTTRID